MLNRNLGSLRDVTPVILRRFLRGTDGALVRSWLEAAQRWINADSEGRQAAPLGSRCHFQPVLTWGAAYLADVGRNQDLARQLCQIALGQLERVVADEMESNRQQYPVQKQLSHEEALRYCDTYNVADIDWWAGEVIPDGFLAERMHSRCTLLRG